MIRIYDPDHYPTPPPIPGLTVRRIPGTPPPRPVTSTDADGEAVFYLDLEHLDGEEAARVLGLDAAIAGELASAMRQLAERLPPVDVGDERPHHLVVELHVEGAGDVTVTADDAPVADAIRGVSLEPGASLSVERADPTEPDEPQEPREPYPTA